MNMSNVQTLVSQDVEHLSLSFSEFKALCVKAARGCGMDWGMAAEAGFAATWLSMHGVEGGRLLCDCLKNTEPSAFALTRVDSGWTASSPRVLCPITLGVALLDYAQVPQGPLASGFDAPAVAYPALLLPFLAQAAQERGEALRLEVDAVALLVKDGAVVSGTLSSAVGAPCASVRLVTETCRSGGQPAATVSRAAVHRVTFEALNALALEADVPATDSSRHDAGSGESDND
jgi:hypothetical protein